jgi:alpha-glucosidase
VVEQYAANNIPLDAMWNDIDYMENYEDFSFDPQRYPLSEVQSFVAALHANNQHYITIVDPGIHNRTGYEPWDSGLAAGLFVNASEGGPFIGQVWPGFTAFPDFLNPAAAAYWQREIANFRQLAPVDGLWCGCARARTHTRARAHTHTSLSRSRACSQDRHERGVELHPLAAARRPTRRRARVRPDEPALHHQQRRPRRPALCLHHPRRRRAVWRRVALQRAQPLRTHRGHRHGERTRAAHWEARRRHLALHGTRARLRVCARESARSRREAQFAGSGARHGHWLGDNFSTWKSMYQSIAGVLSMNMFGIPLGARPRPLAWRALVC